MPKSGNFSPAFLGSLTPATTVPFGKSLKAIIYGERFSRMMKLDVPDDVEQYRIHWVFGTPRLIKLK